MNDARRLHEIKRLVINYAENLRRHGLPMNDPIFDFDDGSIKCGSPACEHSLQQCEECRAKDWLDEIAGMRERDWTDPEWEGDILRYEIRK